VFLDDSTVDGLAEPLAHALAAWEQGDAQLIATAGALAAGSKLRKLFEGDRRALALAIYDDPMDRAEIEAALRAEGLTPPPDAAEALERFGAGAGTGRFPPNAHADRAL
jgi:DNA polymerase III subunit delta